MADMITRCPKCGTAFRISDALLKSAKGVVRCGSCLSVFNAREHLESGRTEAGRTDTGKTDTRKTTAANLQGHPPQSESVQPPRQPPPAPAPHVTQPPPTPPLVTPASFTATEEDDVDMPDWRRRAAKEDAYEPVEKQEPVEKREPVEKQEPDDDEEDEEDDEAWALELLKDDDDLNIQFKKVITTTPPAAPPESRIEDMEEDAVSAPPPLDTLGAFAEIDKELDPIGAEEDSSVRSAESNLAETNAEADDDNEFESTSRYDLANEDSAATADPHLEQEHEQQEEPQPRSEPAKRKPIRPKLEPKSTPLKDVIASLEPEPLEVSWQEPGAWRRRLLWPLLALVALLCLLAQVAWLEFDRLSRIEPYRSVYGVACRFIGCQLPELLDRRQIQTSNLLVRSHPEVADALQVDVILQNNAPFEQPFPVLELTFTNLRSEPVATRTLHPADYLGGELAGREKMPMRQPIHIALEIADPGSEAVSYHITIVE